MSGKQASERQLGVNEVAYSIVGEETMSTKTTVGPGATVRDVLRAKTWEIHKKLHLHASFVELFNETLSLDGYRLLVERLHGFYAPLDRAIDQALAGDAAQTRFSYVARADILARDLADLGLDRGALADSPQCLGVHDIVSPLTVGGILYVVEGSTHGGSVIDTAARKLLGDHAGGRRYWAWCHAENERRWTATNRYLEHLRAEGAALEDLVAGARGTFQLMAEWLAPLNRSPAKVEKGMS